MTVDVKLFFNFRSPYCYLASKKLWVIEDDHDARIDFKALGGWAGRSNPERAKKKLPISRQDVKRWCKRMGIPFNPPPITTDPTAAAAGSFLAVEKGLLRPYVVGVMAKEWAEGRDIGDLDALLEVADAIGLDREALAAATEDPKNHEKLAENARLAEELGVFGVPTFVIGDQIFWGQDRIDFVEEHLRELGA